MRARLIVIIGLILLSGGAIGLYFASASQHAGLIVAAAAVVFCGGFALIAGVMRFMGAFMGSQHAPESEYGKTEVRLLVQAMGALAAADGQIADQEVETIARIYQRMLGIRISPAEVREILADFGESFDIAGRLAERRAELSPDMRRLIVQCCHLVILSDQVEERAETTKLRGVGAALGFSEDDVADLLASAGV